MEQFGPNIYLSPSKQLETVDQIFTCLGPNSLKQFGPNSYLPRAKQLDTLKVFLKYFFEKVDLEKCQQTTKDEKLPSMQR